MPTTTSHWSLTWHLLNATVLAVESRNTGDDDDDEDEEDDEPSLREPSLREPGLRRPTTVLLVTVRDASGKERTETVDAVIDTTGRFADGADRLPNFYAIADDCRTPGGTGGASGTHDAGVSVGLERIRQIFAVIGDRADLDLYTHIRF